MKTRSILARWISISVALLATALLVRAETGKRLVYPVYPPLADGGLQMSLSTSAYRVYAGDPVFLSPEVRAKRPIANAILFRDTVVASVNLTNRSSQDLTFTFADEAAAQRRFDFRVIDSQGEEVWSGGGVVAGVSAPQSTTATLRNRSKWSSVVRIPLKVDGAWLSPGVYTVEAALAGEPRIGATALFEVAQLRGPLPPPEPPQLGGIKGQVFVPTAGNELVVAPGARVSVEELLPSTMENLRIMPGFRWAGVTNAEGRFELKLPAGRFRVVATWIDGVNEVDQRVITGEPFQVTLPLRGSKEVVVTTGEVSEVRLDLKAGLVEIGTRLVSSLTSVKVRVLPTFAPPSMLEVSAEGMVNTGGWSNAQLRQRRVTPEGIIEFDFVAKPPEGMATQAFAPISAKTNVSQPENYRGVRVFTQSNSGEARGW
jgi:hypothetical protein